LLMT